MGEESNENPSMLSRIVRSCGEIARGGLRLVRAQRVTLALAAVTLGFAIPGSAQAAGPVYGFVNAAGTLDPAINGGIVGVSQPFAGQYCFKLGVAAKNAIATIDTTTTGSVDVIMTYVPHGGGAGLSGCPAGFNDAAAVIKTTSGAMVSAGFYILFQT
jgi:hypothetical protein